MKEFISKYWKHPIALVFYAIILILIVYYIGKGKGTIKPNELPDDTSWGGSLTPEQSTNVRALSRRLYKDMDSYMVSVGWTQRDKEAYFQLLGLSDTLFVAVYNDFNDLYFDKGKGTLTQWIDDENFVLTHGASGDVKDAIMLRMQKLNLA